MTKQKKKYRNQSLRDQLKKSELEHEALVPEEKSFADVAKAMAIDPLARPKAQRVPQEKERLGVDTRDTTANTAPPFHVEDKVDWLRGWRQTRARPNWRSMQKGSVDDSLDLHGQRRSDAVREVQQFIKKARERRLRIVRIVVGKGHHSRGGRGVLRSEIADWLSTSPCGEWVNAFCTALPADGGDGAVLVQIALPKMNGQSG